MTGTTHVKGVQNRTTAHGFHCALEQISANEERLEHERTKQALAASKKDIVEKDELILTLKTTLRKLQETLRKKEKDVQTLFAVMRAPQDADLTKKNKQQLIERLIMELQQRVVNCEAVAEARRRELDKLKCSMRMSRNQELEVELEVCYAEIERLRARGGPAHSPVLRPGDAIVGKLRLSAAPADTRPPPKEPPTKKTPRTLSAEATMSSKGQRTGLSSTSSYTSERPQLVRELTATKKESFVSKTRRRAQDAEYLKQVRLAQLETECELEENLHIRAARELRARLAQEQATMKQKLEEQREVIINAQVNELQRLRDATKQQEAERQAAIAAEQATQEQALQMARAAAEAQRVALLDKQARAAQLIQRNWRIRLQRLAQASLKATRAKIEQIEKNVAASASLIQTWWRKKMEDVTAAIAAVAVPSKLVIAPKLDSSNTSDDDEKIGEEDGIEDDTAAVDNAVKPTKDAPAQNVDSLHVAVVKRYDDDEFDDDPEANDDDSIASDTSEPSRMSGKESHGSSGEGEEVAHHPVDIDEYADEKEEHTSETDELTDHKDEHVEASSPDKTTEAPIALTPEKHKQNHDGMEHTPTQGFNLDPHWSPQASQVAEVAPRGPELSTDTAENARTQGFNLDPHWTPQSSLPTTSRSDNSEQEERTPSQVSRASEEHEPDRTADTPQSSLPSTARTSDSTSDKDDLAAVEAQSGHSDSDEQAKDLEVDSKESLGPDPDPSEVPTNAAADTSSDTNADATAQQAETNASQPAMAKLFDYAARRIQKAWKDLHRSPW